MVALASIAAMNTPILALDEPMVGLDGRGRQQVLDWLTGRWHGGATIILVTHDMEAVAAHAERVVVLRDGRIAADGPPGEVFRQETLLTKSGLEKPFAVALADSLNLNTGGGSLTVEALAQAWLAQRQRARDGRGGP